MLAGVGAQYRPSGATAIVTDPQTDQILAVANWPSVNPNHVPASAWSATGGHVPAAEDQAVDISYEPGSTFKAITVAGALAGRHGHAEHRISTCLRTSRPTAR